MYSNLIPARCKVCPLVVKVLLMMSGFIIVEVDKGRIYDRENRNRTWSVDVS